MPSELPIACTLSPEQLPDRVAEMTGLGRVSLIDAKRHSGRAVLRFRPAAREQLAALVAAEAECCAFLTLDLCDEAEAVVLTVEGPTGTEQLVDDWISLFGGAKRVA